jgi:endoglucanase
MKRTLLIILSLLSLQAFSQSDTLYYGVNLAGAEFGSNQPGLIGKDYIYPNEQELEYYHAKGFRLVRLPFKWERIQHELNGPLDEKELSRMKVFIEAAKKRRMQVVLDMHNYGRRKIKGKSYIIGESEVPVKAYTQVWALLAETLQEYENIWGYGIMNEPYDMLRRNSWFSIAQETINSIREVDDVTPIVVGGDYYSSAHLWLKYSNDLKHLKDPSGKLIFEAHIYFDKDASGKYHNTYDEEEAYPEIGVDRIKPFVNWLQENNLKGFVGEYGVPGDDRRWNIVLENFLEYINSHCVNATYWAGGPWWGDYPLSIEPRKGLEKPQIEVVKQYLFTSSNCME